MILMLRTIETSALHFQREKGREGEREGREIGTEREREREVSFNFSESDGSKIWGSGWY